MRLYFEIKTSYSENVSFFPRKETFRSIFTAFDLRNQKYFPCKLGLLDLARSMLTYQICFIYFIVKGDRFLFFLPSKSCFMVPLLLDNHQNIDIYSCTTTSINFSMKISDKYYHTLIRHSVEF